MTTKRYAIHIQAHFFRSTLPFFDFETIKSAAASFHTSRSKTASLLRFYVPEVNAQWKVFPNVNQALQKFLHRYAVLGGNFLREQAPKIPIFRRRLPDL